MLVGDLLVLIYILYWVYEIVPTPNVQHESSMVFIIYSDLPSIHLLLPSLNFWILHDVVWFLVFASASLFLTSDLAVLVYTSIICHIDNYMPKPLCLHVSKFCFLFFVFVLFNKIGLMGTVRCG